MLEGPIVADTELMFDVYTKTVVHIQHFTRSITMELFYYTVEPIHDLYLEI